MLKIIEALPRPAAKTPVKNTERNKLIHSDRQFHDWYRFVLSYPPHLVRHYIEEFSLTSDDLLLDPFCGTGTTLVEAKLQNIPSIGIEANNFAHFATSVKIDWNVNPLALISLANEICEQASEELKQSSVQDSRNNKSTKSSLLRKLGVEQEKLILKDSISPLPLHKSLILKDHINRYENSRFHKYFMLAFGNTLVYDISNLRFGPEVGIGKIKNDAQVVENWFAQVKKISRDIECVCDREFADASVYFSDSRNINELLRGKKVSAVITSPPYPNEKDYTRTTRLESVLLGFINTKDELRTLKKSLLRSNTRGIYKGDDDDEYVKNISEVQRIADEIEKRRIKLGKTSGFERAYAKVTKLYFGGIAKHLIELKGVLRPNARLAYVVGDQASYLQVMIRTGEIIGEIAESLGYEVVKIDLFRTRFSTATKMQLNEEVVILRWPG